MPRKTIITVEAEGFRRLNRKIGDSHLIGSPMRDAFTKLGRIGVRAGRQRAPVGASGRLARSVRFRVPSRPFPKHVTIRANVTRKRARYGYILNVGRFRRGRAQIQLRTKRGRRPTRGWFSGIKRQLAGQARGAIRHAAAQIEARWRR